VLVWGGGGGGRAQSVVIVKLDVASSTVSPF